MYDVYNYIVSMCSDIYVENQLFENLISNIKLLFLIFNSEHNLIIIICLFYRTSRSRSG